MVYALALLTLSLPFTLLCKLVALDSPEPGMSARSGSVALLARFSICRRFRLASISALDGLYVSSRCSAVQARREGAQATRGGGSSQPISYAEKIMY